MKTTIDEKTFRMREDGKSMICLFCGIDHEPEGDPLGSVEFLESFIEWMKIHREYCKE